MNPEQERLMALLTEHIHKRRLDEADPRDPYSSTEAATAWLSRRYLENQLLDEALGSGDEELRHLLYLLVSFTVTLIEFLTSQLGGDPEGLLRFLALVAFESEE